MQFIIFYQNSNFCFLKLAASMDEVDKLSKQLREAERHRKDVEFKGQDAFERLEEKERDLREADKKIKTLQSQVEMQ